MPHAASISSEAPRTAKRLAIHSRRGSAGPVRAMEKTAGAPVSRTATMRASIVAIGASSPGNSSRIVRPRCACTGRRFAAASAAFTWTNRSSRSKTATPNGATSSASRIAKVRRSPRDAAGGATRLAGVSEGPMEPQRV
jgi:hypothetical protein